MALSQAQIVTAYENALQRTPGADEVNLYVSASQAGAVTDAQVFSSISNSQEANTYVDPIVRVYQAAFGRVPDQGGLNQQVDTFELPNQTLFTVSAGITQSAEFTARFGSADVVTEGFLQALYANALGRVGSAAEIQGWMNFADRYSSAFPDRAAVLFGFVQSQEFIQRSDGAVNAFLFEAARGAATYTGSLFANGTSATSAAVTASGHDESRIEVVGVPPHHPDALLL